MNIIRSAALICILLLSGCMSVTSLTRPVPSLALDQPYSFTIQRTMFSDLVYELPSGTYKPSFQDSSRIYYIAPTPVIRKRPFSTSLGANSGIYLNKTNEKRWGIWWGHQDSLAACKELNLPLPVTTLGTGAERTSR